MTTTPSTIESLRGRSSSLTEHTAFGLGIVNVLAAAGWVFLARRLDSHGLMGAAFINANAALVSLFAALHARVERAAAKESLDGLSQQSLEGDLFDDVADDQGERNQVWAQFEKWFVPIFVLALIVVETGMAVYLASRLPLVRAAVSSPVQSSFFNYGVALIFGVAGFALFIFGKYTAGFAFQGGRRQLRGPASLTIFSAFFLGLVVLAFLIAKFAIASDGVSWRNPDPVLIYAAGVALAIFAFDHVLGFVFSFYRPKGVGIDAPPLYDNRVAALFSQPEGVWGGVAEIVDYQFGLKLSESHFHGFLFKVALPLVMVQLLVLGLISCFVVVPAGRRAFVERWGRRSGEPLTPGFHFKYPWPIERVHQSPADLVRTIRFGSKASTPEEGEEADGLWQSLPEGAPLFLTAADTDDGMKTANSSSSEGRRAPVVNLVAATATAQYIVVDPAKYYYGFDGPETMIRTFAERELTSFLASSDGLALIGGDCRALNKIVAERLNALCERLGLGVEFTSVCVDHVQPPTRGGAVDAFHRVMIQDQKSHSLINEAEKYRNAQLPEAKAKAAVMVSEAKRYEVKKLAAIKAESEVFLEKHALYQRYGNLYASLAYLDAAVNALRNPKKIIMAVDSDRQVFQFDLKSEYSPELLDMTTGGK